MTMTGTSMFDPHPPEFDRFLYAPVGEDPNGCVVTVLSALARLGLDPWSETAELVTLGRDAARERIGLLLTRFRDIPSLGADHGAVARELSLLLPEKSPPIRSFQQAASTITSDRWGSTVAILAILGVVFVVVQMLFVGGSGSGQ